MVDTQTIIAIATPPGKGGVGIIRISGSNALLVAKTLTHKENITVRHAHFSTFYDENNQIIDQGLVLYFKNPYSFTGEDVVELQAHGGPVILDQLLEACLKVDNVRLAKPGEFSERAFLNDKIDLVQAEAIADLINATSKEAARSAIKSLQGEFSNSIHALLELIIQLRLYVEAAIDFPEEEIDFINDGKIKTALDKILGKFNTIYQHAKQGSLLQEGMKVVIAGKPNAGKSSLLNVLSGRESAIVTDIAGTTRDVLRESIHIDGMPLHIVDTAGLRETDNEVEKMGIARALEEIKHADVILLLIDANNDTISNIIQKWPLLFEKSIEAKLCIIANKIDLSKDEPKVVHEDEHDVIYLSAKKQIGIDLLKNHLKKMMGYENDNDGVFMARRRHLDALDRTKKHLDEAQAALLEHQAGEIVAEELRLAQNHLNTITGEFTSDDLLGKIFSTFCIGK